MIFVSRVVGCSIIWVHKWNMISRHKSFVAGARNKQKFVRDRTKTASRFAMM